MNDNIIEYDIKRSDGVIIKAYKGAATCSICKRSYPLNTSDKEMFKIGKCIKCFMNNRK